MLQKCVHSCHLAQKAASSYVSFSGKVQLYGIKFTYAYAETQTESKRARLKEAKFQKH